MSQFRIERELLDFELLALSICGWWILFILDGDLILAWGDGDWGRLKVVLARGLVHQPNSVPLTSQF